MEITDRQMSILSYIGDKTNTHPFFIFEDADSIIVLVENEKSKVLGKKGKKIKELENHFKKSIKVIDIKNDINEIVDTLFNKNEVFSVKEDGKNEVHLYLRFNNKKIRDKVYILKNILKEFLNKLLVIKYEKRRGIYGKRRVRGKKDETIKKRNEIKK